MEFYTQRGLDALDRRIVEAEETLRVALLSMGSGAEADNNTWHDNSAFDQAKMDVDQARSELARLKELRRNARLSPESSDSVVNVGSTAIIQIDDDEPMTVHLSGHHVADRSQDDDVFEMATSSPLGSALIGLAEGESREYKMPSGTFASVTVLQIT